VTLHKFAAIISRVGGRHKVERRTPLFSIPFDRVGRPPTMHAIGWTMKKDSLLKSTSSFSLATLISRVLGLVRDSCIAALIPAAWQDIFWLGFRIPSTFRQLFAEGALSAAFIPLLSRVRAQEGEEEGKKLGSAVFYLLTLTVGAVCAAAVVLSPWFVPFLLNFPDDPGAGAAVMSNVSPYGDWRVEAGVKATQIMFPFLFFVALAAWAMGVLNTYRYFFIPAMASSFFNVSLIAGSFIAAAYYEGMAQMWVMGLAVVTGGLLQFAVQIPPTWQVGYFPLRRVSPFSPKVRKFLWMLAPSVFGLAIYQINALITQTYFATHYGEGGVSQMNYAFRLIQFPLGVVGVALATASFPRIAQYISQENHQDAAQTLVDVIKYLMLMMIPSAVGFIVLGQDITALIYDRGKFHEEQWLQPTNSVLGMYALGLLSYTVVKVLVQAFQAHHDFRTPVITGSIAVACNIALCAVFVAGGWPLWSLALASAIASTLHTGLLLHLLLGRMKALRMGPIADFFLRVLVASLGMAAACWLAMRIFPAAGGTNLGWGLRVGFGIGLSLLVYGALGRFLFPVELGRILRLK